MNRLTTFVVTKASQWFTTRRQGEASAIRQATSLGGEQDPKPGIEEPVSDFVAASSAVPALTPTPADSVKVEELGLENPELLRKAGIATAGHLATIAEDLLLHVIRVPPDEMGRIHRALQPLGLSVHPAGAYEQNPIKLAQLLALPLDEACPVNGPVTNSHYNALKSHGFETVGAVQRLSEEEALRVKKLGPKGLQEVKVMLALMNLPLGPFPSNKT